MENIDLSKYQLRTDLAFEEVEKSTLKQGFVTSEKVLNNIKITIVDVLENGIKQLNKKSGR